jgi:hypothetical protein
MPPDWYNKLCWVEPFEGMALRGACGTDTDGEAKVGSCKGYLIRRSKIRSAFYEDMAKLDGDAPLLALDVFDSYGRLKYDYKCHPIRNGWRKLDQMT